MLLVFDFDSGLTHGPTAVQNVQHTGSYLWRKFVHADEKAQRGTLNEAICGRW